MLSSNHNILPLLAGVERALVQEMKDGGMGSLRFWQKDGENRILGGVPAEAHFRDADGMLVIASVIVDQTGAVYELDLWKVDFSPLIRIPEPREIQVGPPESKP